MSFAIPVKRLHETETLMAFDHPAPTYSVHILIVPKRVISGPEGLTPEDADFMLDLFETVKMLVERFGLATNGYRLIANGGPYQDVQHLHFHLISGAAFE